VLTERPTYLGAVHAFAGNNPKYESLSALDGEDRVSAKLAYVMPDFANPTGQSYTLAARQKLIEAAAKHDIVLVEDAAYTDLRYQGAPQPSLLALDAERSGGIEQSRVLYCGTFLENDHPGLRAAGSFAASPVIQKMGLLRQAIDFHNSPLVSDGADRCRCAPAAVPYRDAVRDLRSALLGHAARACPIKCPTASLGQSRKAACSFG
jgi:DNA-binding transcriptional MocR family regulator